MRDPVDVHRPSQSRAFAVHAQLRREAAGAGLRWVPGSPTDWVRRIRICRASSCYVPGLPVVGHQLWSSTFLPAVYQGTYINTEEKGSDRLIQNIRNKSLTREQQREELDLLAKSEP